jgi:hypothetical protein
MTTETNYSEQYPTLEVEATYSAEDNKLRLYVDERLEPKLYAEFRDQGFKYAPKQELFVAPSWTPAREDFCIALAGEIEAEQTTMIERAEAKAERLDNIASNREKQAGAFSAAADQISKRFEFGQPILVGHHSERKARKDQERMHNAMDNANKAHKAIQYWNYKAEGVERHANHKSNPAVRARRIKTLLADLRTRQRQLSESESYFFMCKEVDAIEDSEKRKEAISTLIGCSSVAGMDLYYKLDKGGVSHNEALERVLRAHEYAKQSPNTYRWIAHILNRIAFEQGELGEVARFEGEITPVLLQAFARTHGADKPSVKKTESGFSLVSRSALPLHICEGSSVVLSVEEWRDLMQSVGYAVPAPKPRKVSTAPKKAPLINPSIEEAEKLEELWNGDALARHKKNYSNLPSMKLDKVEIYPTTQPVYSAHNKGSYSPFETIELDQYGRKVCTVWRGMERVKTGAAVCRIRVKSSNTCSMFSPPHVVVLKDKPFKSLPVDFVAVVPEVEAAA